MWLVLLCACERPPEPPDVPLVEAEDLSVVATPLPTCADPAARDSLGPFQRYSGGEWDSQRTPANVVDAAWGLTVADFDDDGLYDIFLPQDGQDQLYLGRPGPTWVDATTSLLPWESAGVAFGSAAADADGDGDLDLVVAQRGYNALLLNDGDGALSLVPVQAFSTTEAENRHVAWGDIDGDGLPELFIGSGYLIGEPDVPSPNQLYQNLGGGHFGDISDRLGTLALVTPANAGGFTDMDRDGDLDLFVVNDKPQAGFVSVLLVNDGEGGLRYDENAHGLNVTVKGMGLALGDLNGDGLDELAITGWNEFALRVSAPDGVWYEAASSLGLVPDVERVVAWGITFLDIDLDGDLDLLVANGPDFNEFGLLGGNTDINPVVQPNGLYLNEDGLFTEVSEDWGIAETGVYRGFAVADLNRDGYPDFVERDLAGPARIYLSRCGEGHALLVDLRMPGPNTRALGARVRLSAGGRVMEREVLAGTPAIASSGPSELLFGLGESETVDELEIRWPDGMVTTLTDLTAGQALAVTRLE